jgi:hypothetical protein
MEYGGIGWARAKPAIDRLISVAIIRYAETHTKERPRYEFASHSELIEHEVAKSLLKKPNYLEQRLLAGVRAEGQPRSKSARVLAEGLWRRGLLSRDGHGLYKLPDPGTDDPGNYSIWLPNTIVVGTPWDEEPPVKRLRRAGCVWTLRLFVDLYDAQNLRDDGGISPLFVKQTFERRKIGEQGPYIIWGFKAANLTHRWMGPFVAHESRLKSNSEDSSPAWPSLALLRDMGLLSYVPHLFENRSEAAEPIHAYGNGIAGEHELEWRIADAADRAARAMALPSKLEEAEEAGFKSFCPVLKTMPDAQLAGVARLTYRPHTRRTAAWSGELERAAPGWIETFEKLAATGEKASLRRAANYA